MKCECCGQEMPIEKKTCALVVGHTKENQGAVGFCYFGERKRVSEYEYNMELGKITAAVESEFCDIVVVERGLYRDLPAKINALKPDFIISLHCNAFNGKASGTETLYYHSSFRGKALAHLIQEAAVSALRLPYRGIKPKHSEDRGGYLLRYTSAPCVILESFFIDNKDDLSVGLESIVGLSLAIHKAITEVSEKWEDIWG